MEFRINSFCGIKKALPLPNPGETTHIVFQCKCHLMEKMLFTRNAKRTAPPGGVQRLALTFDLITPLDKWWKPALLGETENGNLVPSQSSQANHSSSLVLGLPSVKRGAAKNGQTVSSSPNTGDSGVLRMCAGNNTVPLSQERFHLGTSLESMLAFLWKGMIYAESHLRDRMLRIPLCAFFSKSSAFVYPGDNRIKRRHLISASPGSICRFPLSPTAFGLGIGLGLWLG